MFQSFYQAGSAKIASLVMKENACMKSTVAKLRLVMRIALTSFVELDDRIPSVCSDVFKHAIHP
jgi:hypothetical protein